MIHKSVRIYPTGNMVTNMIRSEDLNSHIVFNSIMKPTCALFIDDEIVQTGSFSKEELQLKFLDVVKSVVTDKKTIGEPCL